MALDAISDNALRKMLDKPPKIPAPDKIAALLQAVRGRGGRLSVGAIGAPLFGPGRLTLDEAFYFNVYGKDVEVQDAVRFVGKARQQKLHLQCNDLGWYAAADDKALFYIVVRGAGLPTPETRAISGSKIRAGYPRVLPTEQELTQYLAENDDWPLFLKPIDGMYSIGALKVLGHTDNRFEFFGGESATAEELAQYMSQISKAGYLVQECLSPSPFAASSFGPMVPSVRFLVLFSAAEPIIESAVIKIPSGEHVADNYWRGTNLIGALDPATGTIRRAVSGTGIGLIEHQTHPATSVQLVGATLPNWLETCQMAINAASIFPGIRTQSWDVALTPDGPVLLEFNFGGDLNLHQLAHGRGVLSESYVEHLRRCGYRGRLP